MVGEASQFPRKEARVVESGVVEESFVQPGKMMVQDRSAMAIDNRKFFILCELFGDTVGKPACANPEQFRGKPFFA